MKLSEKEKASHREAFARMDLRQKTDYIFSYYKAYILVPLILMILLGHFIYARITRKEEVFYLGLVNVVAGQELSDTLTEGFLSYAFEDPGKKKVLLYPDLYLSENATAENNRYAYASRIKVLASIEAQKFDVIIANKEAYDIFSESGYLSDLETLLDKEKLSIYSGFLVRNDVLVNDNRIDHLLDEDVQTDETVLSVYNGIDISSFPMIEDAGFGEALYLCFIANSPRTELSVSFLEYLSDH